MATALAFRTSMVQGTSIIQAHSVLQQESLILTLDSNCRMATMVMYCTLPTKGGSTNFRNSGVHVKPVKGNAIFFSYIDPETKLMDNGFTEHSGCPVYEGEKKIVTQWIRYGVDSENKWDSFNTRKYNSGYL